MLGIPGKLVILCQMRHHCLVGHLVKCITLSSVSPCQDHHSAKSITLPSPSPCQVSHTAKCGTLPSMSPCQARHIAKRVTLPSAHPDKCVTLVMFRLLLVKVVVSVQSVNTWHPCQPIRHVKYIRHAQSIGHVKFIRHEKFTRHNKFAHVGSVSFSVLSIVLRKNGR